MIVSFTRAGQCVRCKRKRGKGERWGSMQIGTSKGLLHWFQPRFAICPTCLDEIYNMAEENPSIRRVLGDS